MKKSVEGTKIEVLVPFVKPPVYFISLILVPEPKVMVIPEPVAVAAALIVSVKRSADIAVMVAFAGILVPVICCPTYIDEFAAVAKVTVVLPEVVEPEFVQEKVNDLEELAVVGAAEITI